MSESITNYLKCPVCGNELVHVDEADVCQNCGYSTDPVKASLVSESDIYRRDAAVYRLMTEADTYFSRKNYDEAYISYNSVLDSDPHCLKAVFRREIVGQYLMYETSSVYLSCEVFFHKMREMLTSALENNIESKLMLTMCRDMLDFILCSAEYERKYAVSHRGREKALAYLGNILILLDHTRFVMNCIISVNNRDSAFAAMKCFDTGSELHGRIIAGMEYYGVTEDGNAKKCELSRSELHRADNLYHELGEIKQSILKNADDVLYGELKALEKKDTDEKPVSEQTEAFRQDEYEDWRKKNVKEYVSADRKNIIFGIIAKTAFVFAVVLAVVFTAEAVISDQIISGMMLSAVLLAAVGAVSVSLEKNFDSKRKFYAKLVHSEKEHRGNDKYIKG